MFVGDKGKGFRQTAFAAALLMAAGPAGVLAPLPAAAQASYSYQQPYGYPAYQQPYAYSSATPAPNYNYNYQQPAAPNYGYQQPLLR